MIFEPIILKKQRRVDEPRGAQASPPVSTKVAAIRPL
jgi:hypothetical protein